MGLYGLDESKLSSPRWATICCCLRACVAYFALFVFSPFPTVMVSSFSFFFFPFPHVSRIVLCV